LCFNHQLLNIYFENSKSFILKCALELVNSFYFTEDKVSLILESL